MSSTTKTETEQILTYRQDQVLVVIPTLNEAKHIETCLRSLIENDQFLANATLVVTDGGSTDGTQDIVQSLAKTYPQVQLTHNSARLQSAGINHAVSTFSDPKLKLLIRCDAHSIYPPNFVSDIVRAFEQHPEAASVVSVMDAIGSTCFQRASAWVVDTPLGSGGSAHRGGMKSGWVDHGHHAGFKLDWFNRIDGYDPTFSHNEDAEYDHRLTLAGGKVWLEKDIRLDYQMRPNPSATLKQYWRYGRGRARTIMKHGLTPRLRQLIPVINLALLCVSLLLAPMSGWFLLWPAVYLLVLLGVAAVATLQLRSLCGIFAGVALGLIHNGWAAGFIWEIFRQFTRSRPVQ